jgi:hypothetical protein
MSLPVIRNAFYFGYRRDLRLEKNLNALVLTNKGLVVSFLAFLTYLLPQVHSSESNRAIELLKECVSLVFVSIKCPIPGAFFFSSSPYTVQ